MVKTVNAKIKSMIALVLAVFGFSCIFCQASDKAKDSESVFYKDGHLTKNTSFGGIEVSLLSASKQPQSTYSQSNNQLDAKSRLEFRPEISLFTSAKPSRRIDLASQAAFSDSKSNRYKNTIPAVYRVTLKGYSIMEYSNYTTQTWSLDRVKDKTIRKPAIMFSVTKQF